MLARNDLAARVLVAGLLVIGLFAVRWDTSLQHFDWQVWEASNNLLEQGANPYDPDTLNRELQSAPEQYGPHFEPARRMFLLNPPSWLIAVRLFGNSPLVMSLVGSAMYFGGIVALTRRRSLVDTTLLLMGAAAFAFLSPGTSTFRFGQTGLLVAGLITAQLVLSERASAGVPVAAMSFKPHLAFALGMGEYVRRPRSMTIRIAGPLVAIVLVTTGMLGVSAWKTWLGGMANTSLHPPIGIPEFSIRTLSIHLPLLDLGFIGVVGGAMCVVGLALRTRAAPLPPVILASVAIAAYTSGHAFAHDWLWLPLIPVVARWDGTRAFLTTLAVGALINVGLELPLDRLIVNPLSVMALAITVALVRHAIVEADRTVEGQPPAQAKLSAKASS